MTSFFLDPPLRPQNKRNAKRATVVRVSVENTTKLLVLLVWSGCALCKWLSSKSIHSLREHPKPLAERVMRCTLLHCPPDHVQQGANGTRGVLQTRIQREGACTPRKLSSQKPYVQYTFFLLYRECVWYSQYSPDIRQPLLTKDDTLDRDLHTTRCVGTFLERRLSIVPPPEVALACSFASYIITPVSAMVRPALHAPPARASGGSSTWARPAPNCWEFSRSCPSSVCKGQLPSHAPC